MAIELPKEFKNIPLALLWEYVKLGDELKELAPNQDEESYWQGWHDALATLLGDLTHRPVNHLRPEFQRQFEDFRMEDRLLEMERKMQDGDNG